MSTDASHLLFVYGTLLSSIPSSMSKFLRRRADLVGAATAGGRLVDLGGYPGFVAGGPTEVRGELYQLAADRAEETWQLLDAYEGTSGLDSEEYRRVEIEVLLADGSSRRAQTYEYQQAVATVAMIEGGDYPPFYARNPAHQKFTGHD